jgi:hypothetical protein
VAKHVAYGKALVGGKYFILSYFFMDAHLHAFLSRKVRPLRLSRGVAQASACGGWLRWVSPAGKIKPHRLKPVLLKASTAPYAPM